MGTRSEKDVDESSTDVESVDEAPIRALPLSPDFFVSARAPRRDLLPASLRAGRTGRPRPKHARRASDPTSHPCYGTPTLYLVERDQESEITRIALRRTFEDISGSPTTSGSQETAAG